MPSRVTIKITISKRFRVPCVDRNVPSTDLRFLSQAFDRATRMRMVVFIANERQPRKPIPADRERSEEASTDSRDGSKAILAPVRVSENRTMWCIRNCRDDLAWFPAVYRYDDTARGCRGQPMQDQISTLQRGCIKAQVRFHCKSRFRSELQNERRLEDCFNSDSSRSNGFSGSLYWSFEIKDRRTAPL